MAKETGKLSIGSARLEVELGCFQRCRGTLRGRYLYSPKWVG